MDIIGVLERRKKYPIGHKTTNVNDVDYIISETQSDKIIAYIILPVYFLDKNNSDVAKIKNLILENWHVSGIYDLSKIWAPYTNIEFNLICLNKNKPVNVSFSKYKGLNTFKSESTYKFVQGEFGGQIITEEFSLYLQELSNIIESEKNIFIKSRAYLFTIPYSSFNNNHFSINYYEPDLIENQKKLELETTKILSEVAEILVPKSATDEKGFIISPSNYSYPIQINRLKEGKRTNIELRKGDILLSRYGNNKAFLVNEELDKKLYPSIHTFVIRCSSETISPEYLFLYLQSDTVTKYVIRHQLGISIKTISIQYLKSLPIIIPETIVIERSINLFKTLFETPKEDTIATINSELFSNKSPTKPIQIEFIEEFINKEKNYKLKLIKSIVDDDLREIQKCINANAYKSVIILSGSVLEAVLMDWLSEINQKDYLVSDIDFSLFNMIKELDSKGYFDKPLTDAAHNIREKRNLVHPKKYLRTRAKLDKKTIIKTIDDLKQILQKRL
jgi:hypothetical protein